jgi:endonuclease YncB( thermonuclease family)
MAAQTPAPTGGLGQASNGEIEPATGSIARTADQARPPPTQEAVSPQPSSSATQTGPTPVDGPAEVVDTTTLRIGGKTIRLYGTEWARGGKAEDLKAYLSGRRIHCDRIAGNDVYRCHSGEQDLSRVVLFNGGARASFDAPAEFKDAEAQARAAKRGVWQN